MKSTAPRAAELMSETQLLDWTLRKTYPGLRVRRCYLITKHWGTELGRSMVFDLTLRSMEEAIASIRYRFRDVPHGVQIYLVSWVESSKRPSKTQTNISSLLTDTLRNYSRGVILNVRLSSSESLKRILSSIILSEVGLRRKTESNSLVASAKVKTTRISPESKSVKSTSVVKTNVGVTTTSINVETYRRTYTSVRTPGFNLKKKQGILPCNAHSVSLLQIVPGKYSETSHNNNGIDYILTDVDVSRNLLSAQIATGHLTVDENQVISRLSDKIHSSINLGENIAQSGMAVSLVTNSVKRLATFISLINGGHPDQLVKVLGAGHGSNRFIAGVKALKKAGKSGSGLLAQLWLEYRYGWLPLLQDVDASTKILSNYLKKDRAVKRVTASVTKKDHVITKVAFATLDGGKTANRYFYDDVRTTCRMGIYYRLDSNAIQLFSSLGLTSPLALGWELTPFSFVVDWILPIGRALEAFSAFEGLAFQKGYKTYFTERTVYLKTNESGQQTANKKTWKETSYGKRITLTRTALIGFPKSSMPIPKNPFSAIHAANAVALVVRLLTKH